MPATKRVHARGVRWVLGGHVHMRRPQAAFAAPPTGVPCGIGLRELSLSGHKGLVLHDERSAEAEVGELTTGPEQALLNIVGNQVASGFTRVHIETGDAPRVIVVKHQTSALLVGVKEGLCAWAWVWHVGHIGNADTLGVIGVLTSRRHPLVWRAVADPRSNATVQVKFGTIVRVTRGRLFDHATCWVASEVDHSALVVAHVHRHAVGLEHHRIRTFARAHHRRVDRQEQIAAGAGR